MSDIIERAEAVRRTHFLPEVFRPSWDELIAELKAARAEHDRLLAHRPDVGGMLR